MKVEKLPAVTLAGLLALSINMIRLFLNVLLAVYHSEKYAAFTIFRLCNPNMMFGKVQSLLNIKTHFIRLRSSKRANGTWITVKYEIQIYKGLSIFHIKLLIQVAELAMISNNVAICSK